MVFCLQMVSSKEKWEKKIEGRGKLSAGSKPQKLPGGSRGLEGWGYRRARRRAEAPRPRGLLAPLQELRAHPLRTGESHLTHGGGLPAGEGDHGSTGHKLLTGFKSQVQSEN